MSAGLLALPYGALSQLVAPVSVLAAVAGILWLAVGRPHREHTHGLGKDRRRSLATRAVAAAGLWVVVEHWLVHVLIVGALLITVSILCLIALVVWRRRRRRAETKSS